MEPNYGYVKAAPQTGGPFSSKMLFIIGGLVMAIIIASVLLLSSGGTNTSTQSQRLILRMNDLQAILSDTETTRHLKNQKLSNLVASFKLTQTTHINDLNTVLASQLPEKMDEKIIASETDTSTAATIEEGYLKNQLDYVYADVLTKKIASLRALIAELYAKTKDHKLKQTLENIDKNLLKTNKQVEALSIVN